MSDIHLSRDAFKALASNPSQGPVVMLNLLKFKPGGGSKAYGRYVNAFEAVLLRHGGRFVYLGRAAEMLVGADTWDAVALVEYPSRKVFMEIIKSPEYNPLSKDRDEGLERTVLYATDPRMII